MIGLLRLLLSISVLVRHTGPILGITLVGGSQAVGTFFIISGFFIALVLDARYHNYKDFLISRYLRLFPIYALTLAIIAFVFFGSFMLMGNAYRLTPWIHHNANISSIIILILANISMIGQDIILLTGWNDGNLYFAGNVIAGGPSFWILIRPAWCISIELVFYVLAPLIIRARTSVLFVILTLILAIRFYAPLSEDMDYYFSLCMMPWFIAGVLSYRAYKIIKDMRIERWELNLVSIAIIAFVIFYHKLDSVTGPTLRMNYYLIIIAALPLLAMNAHVWDKWLSDLSYAVFLNHMFVSDILTCYVPKEHLGIVVALVSIILACLLVKIVAPFEKSRIARYRTPHQ